MKYRAGIIVVLLLSATFALASDHKRPAKKGVGEYREPEGAATIGALHVTWYYDWGARPDVRGETPGVQFVPMIWGLKYVDAADLQAAKATGVGILLGFNEPDVGGQSNMTVEQALDVWPKLEALHMRLGSPAPGTGDDVKPDGWLAKFMAGAKKRGYRVDFICIHAYQSSFDPEQATRDLVREVTTVHNMYHRPIWITEYALARWAPDSTPNAAAEAAFAADSARALNGMRFVERYAWYGDVPNQSPFSAARDDGSLTAVGKAWSIAP